MRSCGHSVQIWGICVSMSKERQSCSLCSLWKGEVVVMSDRGFLAMAEERLEHAWAMLEKDEDVKGAVKRIADGDLGCIDEDLSIAKGVCSLIMAELLYRQAKRMVDNSKL